MPASTATPRPTAADKTPLHHGRAANAEVWLCRGPDGAAFVEKDFSSRSFLIRQTAGRFMIRREVAILQALASTGAVPHAVLRTGPFSFREQHCPGPTAHQLLHPGPGSPPSGIRPGLIFFARFKDLVDNVHAAGYVHLDLHNPRNVIVRDNATPVVIDWQSAIRTTLFPPPVRRFLERVDTVGVYKLWAKFSPDTLTPAGWDSLAWYRRIRGLWLFHDYSFSPKRARKEESFVRMNNAESIIESASQWQDLAVVKKRRFMIREIRLADEQYVVKKFSPRSRLHLYRNAWEIEDRCLRILDGDGAPVSYGWFARPVDGVKTYFLVKEFIPGAPLSAFTPGISPKIAALSARIYSHGIITDDAHIANFIARPDGTLVFLDFGRARAFRTRGFVFHFAVGWDLAKTRRILCHYDQTAWDFYLRSFLEAFRPSPFHDFAMCFGFRASNVLRFIRKALRGQDPREVPPSGRPADDPPKPPAP